MGADFDDEPVDGTPFTHKQFVDIVDRASFVLRAVIVENHAKAEPALQSILDEFGEAGITLSMFVWADTVLQYSPYVRRPEAGEPVTLAFVDGDEVVRGDVEQRVDQVSLWCGRLLAARMAEDQETWHSLIEVVPDDQEYLYIGRFLELCAHNLRKGLIAKAASVVRGKLN